MLLTALAASVYELHRLLQPKAVGIIPPDTLMCDQDAKTLNIGFVYDRNNVKNKLDYKNTQKIINLICHNVKEKYPVINIKKIGEY